jgi:uncharacterized RDD family membrane protein YckC/tRNA A-37 threonylcarbamoyl transferase component Bud32
LTSRQESDESRVPEGADLEASGAGALPRPGDVFGDYRIVQELGRGGMGVVWLAEQLSSSRRVALKVILPRERPTARMIERFRREGQLAAAVSHPRCVFVYGAGEVDGLPFIAMEAMSGRTLQDLLRERGRLPLAEAVDCALQVLDGLEAAAAVDVLHRDVKPSNCFLESDGSVKIGDFGLSKSLQTESDLTVTGSFLGTPLYASPEQVRGKPLDLRSDIYSLGATLYHLIAGEPPIARAHAGDLLAAIATEEPAPLRKLRERIPPALERVVAKMLAKDPAERFSDYASLRRALEPFGSGVSVSAPTSWRVGAYLLDVMLLFVLLVTLFMFFFAGVDYPPVFGASVEGGLAFLYFFVSECLFRRSPGKALVGLTVGSTGGGPLGFRQASSRTLLYSAFTQLPYLVYVLTLNPGSFEGISVWHLLGHLPLLLGSERGSGRRGLHEMLSGTRVLIERERAEHKPSEQRHSAEQSAFGESKAPRALGPYDLHGVLFECEEGTLSCARDRALDRWAWVLVSNDHRDPVPASRRNLLRQARLRWLQGGETEARRWNAFEAPSGTALLDAVGNGREMPWRDARRYLLSLARELHAATQDDTLPGVLSPVQVRLLPRGEIQLLDLAPKDSPVSNEGGPLGFLRDVAILLLTGRLPRSAGSAPSAPHVPAESLTLFQAVDRGATGTEGLKNVVECLARLNRARAELSRRLRAGLLLAPSLWFMLFGLLSHWGAIGDHPAKLAYWIAYAHEKGHLVDPVSREAAETFISSEGREEEDRLIGWAEMWGVLFFPDMDNAEIGESSVHDEPYTTLLIRAARESHAAPSVDERQRSASRMRSVQNRKRFWFPALIWTSGWVMLAAAALLTSWVLRGGIVPRLLHVEVLELRGRSATRLRCAARTLCAFGPPLALAGLAIGLRFWTATPQPQAHLSLAGFIKSVTLGVPAEHVGPLMWLPELLFVLSIAAFVLGAAHALLRPERSLPERMSGTHLVPRG